MSHETRLFRPFLCCVAGFTLVEPAAAQVFGRSPPTASPAALVAELRNAPATQLYSIEARLARPTSVREIRAASSRLEVPRLVAHIEAGPYARGRPSAVTFLALGEMYENAVARAHSECRALLTVSFGENDLRNAPIDDWPVTRLHLLANAHVVRELASDSMLSLEIVNGNAVPDESLRKTEDYARNEITQPITKPDNVDLPEQCSKFIGAPSIPILSREFPREFRPPQAQQGESFRQLAFRVLAALPPSSAVTIDLKVDVSANVDRLASLVRDYEIHGMRTELVPQNSAQQVIGEAELTHTLELAPQVHRVRCQIGLGSARHQASGEWYADWISVSLSTENAVRLLSHPNLAQATVTGGHPLAALDGLKSYYEKLAATIYEMPRSIEIPAGCGNVYRHNDQEDVGGISFDARPFGTQ